MFYVVTVKISRVRANRAPVGVTDVEITREVRAASWADAVEQATEDVLDKLSALTGGPIGCQIVSAEAQVA